TSIVVPVYNEDPEVFKEALASWDFEEPDEIIAVVDHSDTDCIDIFREFAAEREGAKLIVTKKPGKRPALADGMRAATSEIVALVDSDTIWSIGVLEKLIAPFVDPEVGGVGSRQNVLETKTLSQKLFDIHLDSRYGDEIRFLGAVGNALTCLSGRTAVYRLAAVRPLLDDLENETFFGRPVISGDDKRLTHLVQAEGWKVRYQQTARVFTPGAPKMKEFLKQRLRWTRNSWRADLRALYDGWVWREKGLALHLIDRIIQPITTLIAPIYFGIAAYRGNWVAMAVLLIWWLFSRGVKIFPHIRRKPSDILILPAYIFFSYVFALFKIFAFFTMNHQGWITRWDSSRMATRKNLRMVPAYSATFGMVFILGLGMVRIDDAHQDRIDDVRFFALEQELPLYDLAKAEAEIRANPPANMALGASDIALGTTAYLVNDGDTLELVAQRYGLALDAVNVNNVAWEKGQTIDLQLPFDDPDTYRANLENKQQSVVTFLPESNTILLSGFGSTITIPQLKEALDKNAILEYEGKGVYLLKASIFIDSHATLIVEGPDVSWLKLQSTPESIVTITSKGGSMLVDQTKLTSWDSILGDVDTIYEDTRSYLLIRNGRLDITDSEIGYLGYSLEVAGGRGGVYGLSWRIANEERFGEEVVTGNVMNSKIHNNYFGIYTFGATGMIISHNEVFDNLQYGIDPHDDSNNLIIEHNHVHGNNNHGIIISKRCVNNVIRFNRSENNRLHGVMLDRQSNGNSVYGNILVNNKDGVAIWDSHRNEIFDNQIVGNQRGVRINRESSFNLIRDNEINGTEQYGVYLYDGASENHITQNDLQRNTTGVYIRSEANYVIDNWVSHGKEGIYLTPDAERNQIVENRIANNEVGIYLKTQPDDYLSNNAFLTNENNIRTSRDWRQIIADQVASVLPH
ncbi:MAG: NosD domain-containing protein, partial [Chloroflexota bacterium]